METKIYREFVSRFNSFDGKIFLIEKLTRDAGFFVYNGNLSFVVKNSQQNRNSINTKFVEFIPSLEIISVANYPSFERGNYDFLVLKEKENEEIIDSFINICSLYINNPIISFNEFIQSIVDLFQLTRQQGYLDCIGLFGELLFLKTMYENGIDFSNYWHLSGIFSKYDISLSELNLEVKTSVNESTTFRIKHSQLFNGDKNIVVLISIRNTELGGESLETITRYFKNTKPFSDNLRFFIALEKELQKKIEPDMFCKRFSLVNICFFDCNRISTLKSIPYNISDVVYDYTFDLNDSFDLNDLKKMYLKK